MNHGTGFERQETEETRDRSFPVEKLSWAGGSPGGTGGERENTVLRTGEQMVLGFPSMDSGREPFTVPYRESFILSLIHSLSEHYKTPPMSLAFIHSTMHSVSILVYYVQ